MRSSILKNFYIKLGIKEDKSWGTPSNSIYLTKKEMLNMMYPPGRLEKIVENLYPNDDPDKLISDAKKENEHDEAYYQNQIEILKTQDLPPRIIEELGKQLQEKIDILKGTSSEEEIEFNYLKFVPISNNLEAAAKNMDISKEDYFSSLLTDEFTEEEIQSLYFIVGEEIMGKDIFNIVDFKTVSMIVGGVRIGSSSEFTPIEILPIPSLLKEDGTMYVNVDYLGW